MVRRQLRTRSKKKVKVRTPGGLGVVHYKKEKPGKAKCGRCKKTMGGMPNLIPSETRALKPSERTPSRPYAGVLCNQCLDELMRYVTRMEVKYSNPDYQKLEIQRDLTLEKFLPHGWHAKAIQGETRKEKTTAKAVEKKVKKEKPAAKKKEKTVKPKKAK